MARKIRKSQGRRGHLDAEEGGFQGAERGRNSQRTV